MTCMPAGSQWAGLVAAHLAPPASKKYEPSQCIRRGSQDEALYAQVRAARLDCQCRVADNYVPALNCNCDVHGGPFLPETPKKTISQGFRRRPSAFKQSGLPFIHHSRGSYACHGIQARSTVGIDLGTTFSTLAVLDQEGNPVPVANEDEDRDAQPDPAGRERPRGGRPQPHASGDGRPRTRGRPRQAVHGQHRLQAHLRRPRDHARVPFRADFEEAAAGRRETDRQDRQCRDHGALLLQRCTAQGHRRCRPYRGHQHHRHHQRAHGGHADLRLGSEANWAPPAANIGRTWHWSTTWGAARSTPRSCAITPSHFQVLATDGDVHLGGIDWNDRLVDSRGRAIHFAARFRSATVGRHVADAAARLPTRPRSCSRDELDHDLLPSRGQNAVGASNA